MVYSFLLCKLDILNYYILWGPLLEKKDFIDDQSCYARWGNFGLLLLKLKTNTPILGSISGSEFIEIAKLPYKTGVHSEYMDNGINVFINQDSIKLRTLIQEEEFGWRRIITIPLIF